ncbi:MAG: hypothetical protein M1480_12505 [Bacteroidetes bacterium]|nr:hypothetical protein [Bacteroidota bacterium]
MNQGVIAVFIPIISVLVIGMIFVTYFYFHSREKQLLIEKGLDANAVKEYFEGKKDPYILMKIGIIAIGFGVGLGLGLILQDYTDKDYWVPFSLFTLTGVGFVVANLISKKLNANK